MEKKIAFLHLKWEPAKFKMAGGRTFDIKGQTLFSDPGPRLDCCDRSPTNFFVDLAAGSNT